MSGTGTDIDPYRTAGTVEEPQKFPLEKITSMSANNYCTSRSKALSAYDAVPVHARKVTKIDALETYPNILEELAKVTPPNTERVTDYNFAIAMNNFTVIQYATGTALIPKAAQRKQNTGLK
ncbi:hypothetical protein HYV87_00205 [Candidatus Woesearchaeota archaeon]|nr:hypothetical protein [Candidatus Woesearchaeota archaeon]